MIQINRLLKEGEPIAFEFSKIEELLANKEKINFKLDLDNGMLLVETLSNNQKMIMQKIKKYLLKMATDGERKASEALKIKNFINKLLG